MPETFIEQAERLKKLVAALHAHFESLTQQRLTLSYQRMRAWDELVKRGYTAADVALVIRWIKAQMGRSGSGYSPSSLQFSRLIQDADLFEDRLNLARKAYGRQEHRDQKTEVSPEPVAPKGWIAWLSENYPHAAIPKSFSSLPDHVQAEANAALL
jgi:hypothetical protein